ncbi:MAG: amidohydrolase [Clostridia bacterium]|nr:amidohydrolase [Clostridia bacterium]
MQEYAVEIRRKLHMYPEVGFELPRTLNLLREELDKMGVSYTEKYGKSSIVATINEDKKNFTIGIRADIDALPICESNKVSYKSKINGQMHACGHDAHCAVALTTCRELNKMRDKINCRVKFIFQAAEEYEPSGAKLMAEDGVMDDIDCIIALHCDPKYEVGEIGLKAAEQGAISNGFLLEFFGKSSHVAFQQRGVDANMMAVKAYTAIEFMFAKEFSATDVRIFNVGAIHGGEANNIISNYCSMYCTLRTYTDEVADKAIRRIKEIGKAVAKESSGRFKYTQKKYYPNVYNNEIMTQKMHEAASKIVGENKVFPKIRTMGGEDFSYFAMRKPGCMLRLGVRNDEKGFVNGVHETNFDIDEDSLQIGVKTFIRFVLDNMDGISFE